MEKTDIINKMTDRLDSIEEHLKKLIKAPVKKKGKKPEVDEEVCPVCGVCNKCSEYYETTNEEED
jgi:hypothetical protein